MAAVLGRQELILTRIIVLETLLIEKGIIKDSELRNQELRLEAELEQLLAKALDDMKAKPESKSK